ncbi:MAG: hypothetical protein CVU77_03515 [Elusimicrobia bacterium HGW-Elusimicrobia-1]|jgi:hypothetical protein|nr:MAG: hypothetical protein CVU77_03515 [Elusimicrobia bacterium HGW-Elusimicrobia-1]
MWLGGWKYRRKITINNSLAYGLSDYQVWIPTSAFGSNWTLIRSSAQPTMADFRFTPSTAVVSLPYWIDSDTTTPNGFRVKISTLPAGNNTIYIYYGNSSAVAGSSVTAVWGSGLVGYWPFGEGSGTTAKDASGNNNNGTLTNSPTWVNGKYGTSLNFNGTNNYVNVPDANSLDITNAITVEAWINPAVSGNSAYRTFLAKRNVGVNYELFLNNDAGANQGRLGWYSGAVVISNNIPAIGVWTHTVATVSGGTNLIMYVNGVPVHTATIAAISANADPLTIGSIVGPSECFSGIMDEVRIYNRTLSESEIKSHYAPTEPTISLVGSEEGLFFSTGTYRFAVIDTASKVVISSVSWNPASQPGSTNISVGIRISSYSFSINSSTPAWLAVSNGQNLNLHGRYIQYQSTFTTTNSTTTPRLEDISVTYRVKPWQEKSVTRTPPNSFGFGGGEIWTWEVPVKSGSPLTITAYIRYNSEYGGSATKPKLTLSGVGISPTSISATGAAENAWELLTINPGTPSQNTILTLRAEGFSTNPGAKFYIDDINISQ